MGGSIMLCSAGLDCGTTVAIFLPVIDFLNLSQDLQVVGTNLVTTPPAGSMP